MEFGGRQYGALYAAGVRREISTMPSASVIPHHHKAVMIRPPSEQNEELQNLHLANAVA